MASPFDRDVSTLRNYLSGLDHSPGESGDGTIRYAAKEHHVKVKDLLDFRNGKDAALAKSLVTVWAQLVGTDSAITMGDVAIDPSGWGTSIPNMEHTRLARYDQFDIITGTRPEADSAESVWADMTTTGSMGEDSRYGGAFNPHPISPNASLSSTLNDISYRLNRYIMPDHQKWLLVRDLAHYGSWFEQIGIGPVDGGTHVARIAPMDPREMRVMPDATPDKTYGRYPRGYYEPTATWPAWKIVHFANRMSRLDTYGRSIHQSNLRSWVQVEAMEAAMITARLEHAPQRFKHIISTKSATSWDDKQKRIKEYKETNKKVRTVDGDKNYQRQRITPDPGADFIVGRDDKDSPADITTLEGDKNLSNITDFQHFFNKFLAGLGPPKLHLGYEADTMRSVGTELTIVFARKARRMQMAFIQGLNHLYWVELILMGIDPRKAKYMIFPPSLGTRDELVRAQIAQTHAMTVQALAKSFAMTGNMPSINWFLKYVMHFDDESLPSVKDLVPATAGTSGGSNADNGDGTQSGAGDAKTGPIVSPGEAANMQASLHENPGIANELKYLSFLLDERSIRRMDVAEIDRKGLLNFGDYRPNFDVEECARGLGIRRALREVA